MSAGLRLGEGKETGRPDFVVRMMVVSLKETCPRITSSSARFWVDGSGMGSGGGVSEDI